MRCEKQTERGESGLNRKWTGSVGKCQLSRWILGRASCPPLITCRGLRKVRCDLAALAHPCPVRPNLTFHMRLVCFAGRFLIWTLALIAERHDYMPSVCIFSSIAQHPYVCNRLCSYMRARQCVCFWISVFSILLGGRWYARPHEPLCLFLPCLDGRL